MFCLKHKGWGGDPRWWHRKIMSSPTPTNIPSLLMNHFPLKKI